MTHSTPRSRPQASVDVDHAPAVRSGSRFGPRVRKSCTSEHRRSYAIRSARKRMPSANREHRQQKVLCGNATTAYQLRLASSRAQQSNHLAQMRRARSRPMLPTPRQPCLVDSPPPRSHTRSSGVINVHLEGIRANEAAQESNLPSDGLRRPAGFEDRIGHQAGAAPRAI
jgi:hypothetical protein